jgi:hypothetical protein
MERIVDRQPFGEKTLKIAFRSWGFYERKFGAGDRGRTGDVQLGKLAFYH